MIASIISFPWNSHKNTKHYVFLMSCIAIPRIRNCLFLFGLKAIWSMCPSRRQFHLSTNKRTRHNEFGWIATSWGNESVRSFPSSTACIVVHWLLSERNELVTIRISQTNTRIEWKGEVAYKWIATQIGVGFQLVWVCTIVRSLPFAI